MICSRCSTSTMKSLQTRLLFFNMTRTVWKCAKNGLLKNKKMAFLFLWQKKMEKCLGLAPSDHSEIGRHINIRWKILCMCEVICAEKELVNYYCRQRLMQRKK